MMRTTTAMLSALLLTMVGLSIVPSASAHYCQSAQNDCGNCNTGLVAAHVHYDAGSLRCIGVGPASTDDITMPVAAAKSNQNGLMGFFHNMGSSIGSLVSGLF